MIHIFLCVIDHANSYSGRCDAGQNTMAIETGFNRKTVRRCLEWLEVNTPFLKIERERPSKRGKFRTNAYHVQWGALEVEWNVIQTVIEGEKQWARHDG